MRFDNWINSVFLLIFVAQETVADDQQLDDLPDRLIHDLYKKYKEAMDRGGDLVILRRQFDNNQLFEIHVKKLKEVNGFKLHNLMIKGKLRSGSPFIYINNPVESKMPNAYLTLEEFKEALTKRVQKPKPTTVKIIDVVFAMTAAKRPNHKTPRTKKPSLSTNTTNYAKATTKGILRLPHNKTFLAKGDNASLILPPADATTQKLNITSKPFQEAKTVPNTSNTYFNMPSNRIKDLIFLRTSPLDGYSIEVYKTEIGYSYLSTGSDKDVMNSTVVATTDVDTIIITNSDDSYSVTEQFKLNRHLLVTSESSRLINKTEASDLKNIDQTKVIENITIHHRDTTHKIKEPGYNVSRVLVPESTGMNSTDTPTGTSFVSPVLITTNISQINYDRVTEAFITSERPETFTKTTVNYVTKIPLYQMKTDVLTTTAPLKDPLVVKENTVSSTKNAMNTTGLENATAPATLDTNNMQLAGKENITLVETTELTTAMSFKKSKREAKATQQQTPSGRHTPWRARTKARKPTGNTSATTKRSTLGRPLVFIGGPGL